MRILFFLAHLIVTTISNSAEFPASNIPTKVYRESQGKVTSRSVDLNDSVLRITFFIKLKDGKVIDPKLYYFQLRKILFRPRSVEEVGRIWTTIGRDVDPKYRVLHLPKSEEIDTYLFLVRKQLPKQVEVDGHIKTEYELSEWQLLELDLDQENVAPDKPIQIPPYEELAKREVSEVNQELLKNLIKKYNENEAAAYKKASTPVPPKPLLPGNP